MSQRPELNAAAEKIESVVDLSRPAGPPASAEDDASFIDGLQRGDEEAFGALIDRYQASLVRVAMTYVRNRAVADEVVQETWMGLLDSLPRFERRCSLKTWLFTILIRCARRHGHAEARSIPFSALWQAGSEPVEAALGPERFFPSDHRWAGVWQYGTPAVPRSWEGVPEERLLSAETRRMVKDAIASLPPAQREVMALRDVEGWTAEEVCSILGITNNNQRVLLHRGRAKVRSALERYLG